MMMLIERFDHAVHLPILRGWLEDRGTPDKGGDDWYPDDGFMVDGIAVGFLYRTGTPVAYLDNFVTSPKTDAPTRRRALDALIGALVHRAESIGVQLLIVSTPVPTFPALFVHHGFAIDPKPHRWMVRRFSCPR